MRFWQYNNGRQIKGRLAIPEVAFWDPVGRHSRQPLRATTGALGAYSCFVLAIRRLFLRGLPR